MMSDVVRCNKLLDEGLLGLTLGVEVQRLLWVLDTL